MDTKISAEYYNNMLYNSGAAKSKEAAGLTFAQTKQIIEQVGAGGVAQTKAATPEDMLKAKYPNAVYHVFDASSSYWKTRTDYPHYLLYQNNDKAKEVLSNWQPEGENPFYGSIDGKFIAPKEIHALGNVPPGSKAAVIHPDVQARMEQDPEYAAEIIDRIDAWFQFDIARNNAISGRSDYGKAMSQAVAIGKDGNIVNACSSTAGGGFTQSASGTTEEDGEDMWEQRAIRHKKYMMQKVEDQIEHNRLVSRMQNLAALTDAVDAKERFKAMVGDKSFVAKLGTEISGMPIAQLMNLALTQIFG